MEKTSSTRGVRNEETLHTGKEERNILTTIIRREAHWTGHILRRNCLPNHVVDVKVEERIEVAGRQGRRRKQQMNLGKRDDAVI